MKKLKSTLIIFFLMVQLINAQQLKLKLQDAVSIALQNNPTIKEYEERYNQKSNDVLSSYGNFLPSLNFGFSYTHLNDNMIIDLNPIRDVIINLQAANQVELTNLGNIVSGKLPLTDAQKLAVKNQAINSLNSVIPPFEETFKKQDYKTGTLTVVQPLFLGGKLLAAKSAASNEKSAANYELQKVKNEIQFKTIDAYLKVILLQNLVNTRINVLEGMKQHKSKAQKLFDEGLIASHHLLRAEVAVDEAERNLEKDKNTLSLAVEYFKSISGIDKNIEIEFCDSLSFQDHKINLDSLKQVAKENQPILKIVESKKELAHDNFAVARSSFLPTVAGFGKYEIYPQYLSSLEPRWAVGLQLNFNLFNGFKDYLKLQNAKLIENEVEFLQKDLSDQIDLWLTNSYLEVNNNKTQYDKLNSSVALAKENLRQNEKRFETGMGTSLEVIDAQLSLEKVELNKLTTLYQYYSSIANLYLATGNPSEIFNVWKN